MNKRLQQFLKAENISQSVFADTIGVARASISHILAGRNKPGFDFIESMSRHYPNVNLEWLITGKGRMYKAESAEIFPVQAPLTAGQTDISAPFVPELRTEPEPTAPNTSSITLAKNTQTIKAQRSISKIMVLYNDGSYQEFK